MRSVLIAWLALSAIILSIAVQHTSVPGLNYDETQAAAMARDFLTGHAHNHMIESRTVKIAGRPFPLYLQSYIGAVKSWILLPPFVIFGSNQSVLRLTATAWTLVILLIFMIWTNRWLGKAPAIMAGFLMGLDPAFLYASIFDWGLTLPSYICRFACFYFAMRAWRAERLAWLFAVLAGAFAGLGFLNKIDFAVLIGGVVFALLCVRAHEMTVGVLRREIPRRAVPCVLMALGFFIAAAPMLAHMPGIFRGVSSEPEHHELPYKCRILLSMYDGSFFYHLMDAGGVFERMFLGAAPVLTLFGVGLIASIVYLLARHRDKTVVFLLLSILFITIGFLILPKAIRIHHAVLVYPFPHLLIALALARLPGMRIAGVCLALILGSQLVAIWQIERLICATGGRGWWSDSIEAFARQVADRKDLTIDSLDWGFNEQLAFLTDGPALAEPFWWGGAGPDAKTNHIYLTHAPAYTCFPFGKEWFESAHKAGLAFETNEWRDHQGQPVFYSIRYRGQIGAGQTPVPKP